MSTALLGDRYVLGERVGSGAMADVFAASDTVLDRPVAIKVLRGELADDTTFVERFRREARLAAQVHHRNVVQVFDCGSDDDECYIVMEYVRGSTLQALLEERGPLSQSRADAFARQLLQGLAAAHDRGLVHRDIKPQNLLIDESGLLRIADFGVARHDDMGTLTQAGSVLGTALYISPEQARGERVDARSDLYSTGAVIFEMLAGHPPFPGDTPVEIMQRQLNEPPPRLRDEAPEVDERFDRVVDQLLAKHPDDRFPSAAAVLQALDATMSGAIGDNPADTVVLPGSRRATEPPIDEASAPAGAALHWHPPDVAAGVRRIDQQLRRSGRLGSMAAPVAAAAAVLVATALVLAYAPHGRSNLVPDVRGSSRAQATLTAQEHGLELQVRNGDGRRGEAARIERQEPSPGSRMADDRPLVAWLDDGR